jgi:Domain of unknown function (DUF1929)
MRTFLVPDGGLAAVQRDFAAVIAIHAALLRSGKILYFGGDQHDPGRHHLGLVDGVRLFDCATLGISTPAAADLSDFFCCGHAFLPSGQLLIGGGTQYWAYAVATPGDPHFHARSGHFRGLPDTWRFDAGTETFHRVADMRVQPGQTAGGGRWYPTLLTMSDGRVLAVSGHPSEADALHFNNLVEAFRDDGGSGWWEEVATMPHEMTLYPRAHGLPNGRIFFSSPHADGSPQGTCYTLDPHAGTWTPVCTGPGPAYAGFDTSAVLLPLVPEDGYRPRALLVGASGPLTIDLGDATPSWHTTGPRTLVDPGSPPSSPIRHNVNAVLLPTGDVAVVGGIRNVADDPGSAVHEIELYRHETDSWVTLPPSGSMSVSRSYHSVALLMPDGRVWVAGSNVFCTWSFHDPADYPHSQDYPNPQQPITAQDDHIDHRHLEIEIFEPWYVGRPDRPAFAVDEATWRTGETRRVNCAVALEISRVVLIRPGSVTHSFNPDQRWVALSFSVIAPDELTVTVPNNANLLPPGAYLAFLLRQVVDPSTSAVLEVPSTGIVVSVQTSIRKPLKPELEIPRKSLFDTINDPKLLVEVPKPGLEGVAIPGEDWVERVAGQEKVIGELAERLDELQSAMERSKVFVREELRPPVGVTQPVARSYAFANQLPVVDPMVAGGARMGDMGAHEAGHGEDPGLRQAGPAEPDGISMEGPAEKAVPANKASSTKKASPTKRSPRLTQQ